MDVRVSFDFEARLFGDEARLSPDVGGFNDPEKDPHPAERRRSVATRYNQKGEGHGRGC